MLDEELQFPSTILILPNGLTTTCPHLLPLLPLAGCTLTVPLAPPRVPSGLKLNVLLAGFMVTLALLSPIVCEVSVT